MNNPLNGLGSHQMQFAPVPNDDDVLSQSIDNDVTAHDDDWQLSDDVDASKLEAFWDEAASVPDDSEELES
jgi:hypothetical protein